MYPISSHPGRGFMLGQGLSWVLGPREAGLPPHSRPEACALDSVAWGELEQG